MANDLTTPVSVDTSTTDETPPAIRLKFSGEAFPRFSVTPSGVYDGSGSAAPQQRQPRGRFTRATAAIAESWPRLGTPNVNVAPLTTQQLYVCAIDLPANLTITGASFTTGTQAAVVPTNWWYTFSTSARVVKAVTADQLTAAMAASTDLPVAFGTPYTTTAAGLYYVGIMAKADTVPSLQGLTTTAVMNTTAPILAGTSNTAQTTPPALAATLTAVTAGTIQPYFYLY